MVVGGSAGGESPQGWPVVQEGRPAMQQGRLAVQPGWPPVALWQSLHSLARVRWLLANFGGLFGLVQGLIFNPKEAGTQLRNTMNQTKEI